AEDANRASALAAGLVLDAVADHERVVPGQTFRLELTVWNGGAAPVEVRSLAPVLPDGWQARLVETCAAATGRDCPPADPGAAVAPGALLVQRYEVSVPADAPATEPYYLRRPRDGDLYRWTGDEAIDGLPFQPADVRARAKLVAAGTRVTLERDVQHRVVDRVLGEVRRPVMVVPAVSVALEPGAAILPLGGTVTVGAGGDGATAAP